MKDVPYFEIVKILRDVESTIRIPLFSAVQAGFPSPASDFIELELDFNSLLVSKPYTTFCVRVRGNSMQDAHIYDNDILIVDRSVKATNGKIVVAILNGDFTVKRLSINQNQYSLVPDNPQYPTIQVKKSDEFEIWGVVTFIIHQA